MFPKSTLFHKSDGDGKVVIWIILLFPLILCYSVAIETGPVVMTDLCSQVALADAESSMFRVVFIWTSKLQHSLVHTHLLVCTAPIPKHQQHPGPTAAPPSFSHTPFPPHWNPVLGPHLSSDLHDEILFECLVCVFCKQMLVGTILSCQRGSTNTAGKDQALLFTLLPDVYPEAT